MAANTVGYTWTFMFLMLLFILIGLCWAVASVSNTFHVLISTVMIGTVVIVVKTLVQVVVFDRQQFHQILSKGSTNNGVTLMESNISKTCPDYNSRSLDEGSGAIVCSNTTGNYVFGNSPVQEEIRLGAVDPRKWCVDFKNGANTIPWLAMQKYCQYAQLA